MLWAIIKKEFLSQVVRFQFIFSSAIILVLVVLGMGMLVDEYGDDVQDRKENESIHRAQLAETEEIHDALRAFKVERPIAALRPVASGSERAADPTIELGPNGVTGSTGAFDKNPIFDLFPQIDLVFIIGVFLSLVVFVLSYDSVCGERQDGTLRLVFSYNVPRDTFILGKWTGGLLSLSVPLILGFATAAFLMITSRTLQLDRDEWIAFGGILVLSFLYITLMYAVGLFVSCRSRHPATAISVLLFIWVVIVLVIPNAMPYLASLIRPIDNPARIQERVAATWADINSRYWEEAHQKMREMGRTEEYWEWRRERARQRDADFQEARESILGPYRNEKTRFDRVAMGISRLSPLAAYTYGATRLAQTGPETEVRIDAAVEQVRVSLAELESKFGRRRGRDRDAPEPQGDFWPKLKYDPETIEERMGGAALDAAILLGLTMVLFLGTFVSFVRMDLVE